MLMLSAHWLGCLYYFFTSMDTGKDTWLKNYLDGTSGGAIGDRGNGEIYLAVLYWALTTMSTIGYGDIIPVSTTERVITSFAMILGSCIFAYGLTNVCFLVYNYNRYQVTYETSMDEFSEYFERQRVPPELVRRIQTFFWFTHYSSNVEDDPELENRLFSVLPPGLRRDLKMHVSENGINTSTADMRNHPMLYFTRKHCAEQRVDFELAKLMEGAVFTPEDQVVLGATGRVCPAVSILLKGMLVLTHCDPAQGAVSCGPGTSFGEVSIVMDRPMMGKDFLVATPDRFVEVQVLNRAPLVALLTEHWSLNAALQKLYSVPAHQRDYFQYEDILLLKEYIDTHEDDFSSQIMAPAIPSADPSVRRMQRTDRIAELTQLMEDKKLQLSDLKAELARLQFLEQEHVQITAAASQSGQAAPH